VHRIIQAVISVVALWFSKQQKIQIMDISVDTSAWKNQVLFMISRE